jgi:light-regulated signal transduction histidine kinase (bacteriophytochrome)
MSPFSRNALPVPGSLAGTAGFPAWRREIFPSPLTTGTLTALAVSAVVLLRWPSDLTTIARIVSSDQWHGLPGLVPVVLLTAVTTFCLALTIRTARALGRAEQQRERAQAEVERLSVTLEDRVRERTAALEHANHELEAFSYSVSHDLRSPLRVIAGYGSILAEDYESQLDAEGRRLLAVVQRETHLMGRLIDDLLRFSRLGRQAMTYTTVDMTALAREVLDGLEGSERVVLTLDRLPAAPGDSALLRMVWENLLGNALKFTGKAVAPRIHISASRRADAVTYWVRDNGAGFDPRYKHRLFGVFQRLHRDEEFEGTGIGLANVQRIVHRHGGSVDAEGAIGHGATISFTLPLTAEER